MSGESELNYYELLGCSSDASYTQLKQAYHELVLQYHPDKISDSQNTASKFHEIDGAWKILRDPYLRKQYDIEFRQAELEAEGKLIYARLKPAELTLSEDKDILTYQCRCGSSYAVNIMDITEKNSEVHIPCEECTFSLVIET